MAWWQYTVGFVILWFAANAIQHIQARLREIREILAEIRTLMRGGNPGPF